MLDILVYTESLSSGIFWWGREDNQKAWAGNPGSSEIGMRAWIVGVLTAIVIAGCRETTAPAPPPAAQEIPLMPPPIWPGDDEPSWSPDGSRIAYHRSASHQIFVYTLAAGTTANVTSGGSPSWSP